MEIRSAQTGPLTSPAMDAALPPDLASLSAQLPPQLRHEVASLHRQASSIGSPLAGILNPDTEVGARALKGYYKDLANSAPTKELAELFEAASRAVMTPQERKALVESTREVQEAVRRIILARQQLADGELRAMLQAIRLEDIQLAKDLLTAASRADAARQADRITAEQQMAVGLVTAIAVPAVSQSKLEGVTSSALARRQTQADAKVDERMTQDQLETARGDATQLRLEDFAGARPDERAAATDHLRRMRDFAD